MIRATKESEMGAPPNPAVMAAVGKLAQEAKGEGVLVDMGGLAPSAMGARVRASGGAISAVDGPFAETKELIAGYSILEVGSREEAIEQARRLLQAHLDVLGPAYEGECEVRQIFGGME